METLRKVFPGLEQYKGYDIKRDLSDDIFSGITIFFTLVPQGLAYGKLAGLPPVYGLYAAAFPLFLYALFGTARHLVFGPFAITSFMLGQIIAQYQFPEDSLLRVHLALYISFISGILYLLVWAAKFGRMVTYITPNVLSGFITGCAGLVALNQVTHMLGFKVSHQDYTHSLILAIFEHLDQTTWEAVIISIPTFGFIWACSKYKKSRAPYDGPPGSSANMYKALTYLLNLSSFIGFIVGLLVSYVMITYEPNSKLIVVGNIPQGFQPSQFDPTGLDHDILIHSVPAALTLMLVAWMTNWAIAKRFAEQFKYEVDSQKELLAYAVVNIVGALGLNSFINAAGMARCAVAAEAGAKTQLSNVIAAALMVIGMYTMAPVLYYIPMPTLGSIISVSVASMIDISKVKALHKSGQKVEAVVVLVTIICTFFLGITQGLVLGIFCSFAGHLYENSLPRVYPLGVRVTPVDSTATQRKQRLEFAELSCAWNSARVNEMLGETAQEQDVAAGGDRSVLKAVPGIAIARVGTNSLYFGNASYVRDVLFEMARCFRSSYTIDMSSANLFGELKSDTRMLSSQRVLRALIVDISFIRSIDERTVLCFVDLMKDLWNEDIALSFVHSDWEDECADDPKKSDEVSKNLHGEISAPWVDSERSRTSHASTIYRLLTQAGFVCVDDMLSTKKKCKYLHLFQSLERAVKYYSAQICLSNIFASTKQNDGNTHLYVGDHIPNIIEAGDSDVANSGAPLSVHRPRAPSGKFREEDVDLEWIQTMSIGSSHGHEDGSSRRSSESIGERMSDNLKGIVFAQHAEAVQSRTPEDVTPEHSDNERKL